MKWPHAAAPSADLKRQVWQKRSFKRRSRRSLNDSLRDTYFLRGAKICMRQGARLLLPCSHFLISFFFLFTIKAAINSAQVVLNVKLWALSGYPSPPLGVLSLHQSSKLLKFLMCESRIHRDTELPFLQSVTLTESSASPANQSPADGIFFNDVPSSQSVQLSHSLEGCLCADWSSPGHQRVGGRRMKAAI